MAFEGQKQDLSSLSVRMVIFSNNVDPNLPTYIHRVGIDLEAIQRFKIDAPKAENEQLPQVVSDEPVPRSRREIVYNRISEP